MSEVAPPSFGPNETESDRVASETCAAIDPATHDTAGENDPGHEAASDAPGVGQSSLDLVSTPVYLDLPSVLSTSTLRQDLEGSESWNEGAGLFVGWTEKAAGGLLPAYRLSLRLEHEGHAAVAVVMKTPWIEARARKPQKGKTALLSVLVTFKPEEGDETQSKLCSDYGAVLSCAREDNVAPANFLEWASRNSVRQCKERRTARRKAMKATPKAQEAVNAETGVVNGGPASSLKGPPAISLLFADPFDGRERQLPLDIDATTLATILEKLTTRHSLDLDGLIDVLAV